MRFFVFVAITLGILLNSCGKEPRISPETAREMIVQRNLGMAYLEEEKPQEAAEAFEKLIALAPEEPLGYANLGLSQLRLANYAQAEKWLTTAVEKAPDNPDIRVLLATAYKLDNQQEKAVETLKTSLKNNPTHLQSNYLLAQLYLESGNPQEAAGAEPLLNAVLETLPANVAARLQLCDLYLARQQGGEALQQLETIRQVLPVLPDKAQSVFDNSIAALQAGKTADAAGQARAFHNLLKATPFYKAALAELTGTLGTAVGNPLQRFASDIVFSGESGKTVPDFLSFTEVSDQNSVPPAGQSDGGCLTSGDFDGDGDVDLFLSRWNATSGRSERLILINQGGIFLPGSPQKGFDLPGRDVAAFTADIDNDGYLDIFVGNDRRNLLFLNEGAGTFREVNQTAGLLTSETVRAAVFADLDLEGDLDVFLATDGQNHLFRNNGDGTFSDVSDETGIEAEALPSSGVDFADFDDDGDPDLVVCNRDGENRYYDNLRQSFFRENGRLVNLSDRNNSAALAVADFNNDSYPDLFVGGSGGGKHLFYRNSGAGTFEVDSSAGKLLNSLPAFDCGGAQFIDADNDGRQDLLLTSASGKEDGSPTLRLLMNGGDGNFRDGSALLPRITSPVGQAVYEDFDDDGDLDILVLERSGQLRHLRNDGGNINNYLVVRLSGLRMGSSKNNTFGIGAKVEVKAGDLYQMQVMNRPRAHFGIGNLDGADVLRILWSNGVPQNHLKPAKNQTFVETQILKGSCPWLFTWDGEQFQFATDVLWASAIGMPLGIMAGEVQYAFHQSAQEYFKIPGEKLKPRNGSYRLQFTSQLWESAYLDQVRLVAVDHPADVEIFVDEAFYPPPFPAHRIFTVRTPHLPVSATDEQGRDLLPDLARHDGRYVDHLVTRKFQGLTRPHDLILDLGEAARADSVFLFLNGWLFPTDASINVNIAQAGKRPIAPHLQVINSAGQWETAIAFIGFPKGKNKTTVLDLSDKFLSEDRRVRIRTDMQIYWDYAFFSTASREGEHREQALAPQAADLHFGGFSEVRQQDRYSPHIPSYGAHDKTQKWRDLTGTYTRFGDVLPLLQTPDSKYVLMNAGDEITLDFDATALADLPEGWTRDFLFYNDGWLKDGDLSTAHGQTLGPLPFREMSRYPYGAEEHYPDSPEYRAYRDTYNTREVTTENFRRQVLDY